jgi:hypothetical protein
MRWALNTERTNVVIAKAARPSGAGSATGDDGITSRCISAATPASRPRVADVLVYVIVSLLSSLGVVETAVTYPMRAGAKPLRLSFTAAGIAGIGRKAEGRQG